MLKFLEINITYGSILVRSNKNIVKVCSRDMSQLKSNPFKWNSKKLIEKHQDLINRITISNQHELLAEQVTPYYNIPYEEELEMKQQKCVNVLEQFYHRLSINKECIGKVLNNIIPSPTREAYRSKDDFSVWKGIDGNPKTVGFFIGLPSLGKVVCVPPTKLKCIKESHKRVAELYQEFIRSSPLAASYKLCDGGFWRNIRIRSNDAGDHQVLVVTHPSSFTPEFISEQQQLLKEYFVKHAPSVSLFHQSCPHVSCSRDHAPIHHLNGQSHLSEMMSGVTFRLSADSFFQSNKPAAEILFQTVLGMAKLKHFTTLLDLYCGTGAVSLLGKDFVRGSVGIEEMTAAVDDANYNAHVNNITNCKFIAGRVEDKLAKVLKNLDHSSHLVAVVNPGRAGAAEGVVSLLRKNAHVSRVIYVSCKPDNPLTMKNFVQLCERVGSDSKPFRLTKAVPVDLFPLTSQLELILCFDKT